MTDPAVALGGCGTQQEDNFGVPSRMMFCKVSPRSPAPSTRRITWSIPVDLAVVARTSRQCSGMPTPAGYPVVVADECCFLAVGLSLSLSGFQCRLSHPA